MCNCLGMKCYHCDAVIQIHIADYCTSEDNVRVICPQCIMRGKVYPTHDNMPKPGWDRGELEKTSHNLQVEYKDGTHPQEGSLVAIFCCDPAAWGVNLN